MQGHLAVFIDDSEPRVDVCEDCGAPAPTANTNYTVITSRYGWRLTHVDTPEGTRKVEWRCRKCWAAYRARQPTASKPQH